MLFGALLCAVAPASASAEAGVATVELSSVIVLRVRDAAGWESVHARADEIYRRINEAINQHGSELSSALVSVRQMGEAWSIYIGEDLIVTVDSTSARLNGVAPSTLARVWAGNLKRAIDRYLEVNAPAYPPVF